MWRYAAARTTGTSHLRTGAPCQDRFACFEDGRGGLVVAVSDGAGSAARSDVGAEIAVTTALDILRAELETPREDWSPPLHEAASAARSAVLARAIEDGAASRDYACTLLLLVLAGDGGGALQIGDGVIAYRDQDGWGWVFWPQKGEYANTTRFLTEDDAEAAFELSPMPAYSREVAVMTDGLEGLALHFSTRSVHEPFLEALMQPLRASEGAGEAAPVSGALEALLASPRISDRADDDLTIVLATRPAAAA